MFANTIDDFYNDELEHLKRIKDSAIQGAQKKDPLEIINSCATKLGIIVPEKVKRFIYFSTKMLEQYFIILKDANDKDFLCVYIKDNPKELESRKILCAFAYILRENNIVDAPKNAGEIPSTKYVDAFRYSHDGEIVQNFNLSNFTSQASANNAERITLLKRFLGLSSDSQTNFN